MSEADSSLPEQPLTGIWADVNTSTVHLALAQPDGSRTTTSAPLSPFAWSDTDEPGATELTADSDAPWR
ncbi:MAG: hypothetical protein ACFB21_03575, partial [Opitutales bacterium]